MTSILINGEEKNTININDRGLQYGDGLFETMAVHEGKVKLWEDHWQRLVLGCEKLSITLPSKDLIEKEIKLLCSERKDPRFIIKLILTRGEGERGYSFTAEKNVTRILSTHNFPSYPYNYQEQGVEVRYCETTLSENERLAGIKHLNRLEQVLARNEWDNDEFQEGLMLTKNGNVVDGTMSNIFAVTDNIIYTPKVSFCGVDGVMRKTIIKIAKKLGFAVYEVDLDKNKIETADELFLTNSIFGIWPIIGLAKTHLKKVGRVTRQFQDELKTLGW